MIIIYFKLYACLQLFRRVAAALPGMEQTEPRKDQSILFKLQINLYFNNSCLPFVELMKVSVLYLAVVYWLSKLKRRLDHLPFT